MCAHVCHEKGGTGFPGPEELDKAETRGCGKIVIIRSHRPAGRSVPAGLFLNGLPFGPANGKIKEIRTGNNGIACFRKLEERILKDKKNPGVLLRVTK